MKARWGLTGRRLILYLGRVCRQKGTDVLVDAFLRFGGAREGWALVVAGPPERFGRDGGTPLTEAIRKAGGHYAGPLREEDLCGALNACDVFVMPTREDEIFGMAAVEAQACGKPAICSRLGGLPEVVTEGSGVFFEPGSSDGLLRALEEIAGNDALRERLADAARASSARFSWKRVAMRSLDIYGSLLS